MSIDKRRILAELFEKTGIKVTEDDPAFMLVELNLILLNSKVEETTKSLDLAAEKFGQVTTRSVDDFVDVANEALGKFIQRTNEIKALLNQQKESDKSETQGPKIVSKEKGNSFLVIPLALSNALLLGVLMAVVVLK